MGYFTLPELKGKPNRIFVDGKTLNQIAKESGIRLDTVQHKYKIIYADPAWLYRDKAVAGGRGAGCHYTVTSLEDIKALPVEKLADDDSVLFMWVTMPFLEEAFDVMRSWGFEYKTCAFTWIKQNKKAERQNGSDNEGHSQADRTWPGYDFLLF